MGKRLRFRDLKARGIVANRATLRNWIRDRGFPPGQLTGPNTRTWDEDIEINPWLASRPTAPKPAPVVKGRRGRPAKATQQPGAEA
jgi:predicted DNA-binding transcriptional regulator AlpA